MDLGKNTGLKPYSVLDFSGGINENASDYVMAPNEIKSCENIELRKRGTITIRKGHKFYHLDNATSMIDGPVMNQFRYTRKDGTRKMMMYALSTAIAGPIETAIFVDDDAGTYGVPITVVESTDGYCRFAQFRDTVFFGTDTTSATAVNGLRSYNSGAGGGFTLLSPSDDNILGEPANPAPFFFSLGALTVGGQLLDKVYIYRFTFEIYHGDDFVGESFPVNFPGSTYTGKVGEEFWDRKKRNFFEGTSNFLAGTKTNIAQFAVTAGSVNLPGEVKYVNIYRAGPFDVVPSDLSGDPPINTEEDVRFYFVGSMDGDSLRTDPVTTVEFSDDGTIPLGKTIRYTPRRIPPQARFIATHKNRLWLAYGVDIDPVDSVETIRPYRVYISEFNSPYVFPPGFSIDIGREDADGITGMVSYRDKVLIVFKNNSMWAISGGDDEFLGNLPNISVENIDDSIGCTSPESIVIAEGRVMWMSHRGMYYYDGTTPQPLKDRHIEDAIFDIPEGRIYNVAAEYYKLERELWVAHSDSVESALFNKVVHKYHFEAQGWTRHVIQQGAASFVEKKALNERPTLYMGVDEAAARILPNAAVIKADVQIQDDPGPFEASAAVPWSIETRKMDFNLPYVDKELQAISIDGNITDQPITVHIKCDERLDTEVSGPGFTIAEAISGKHLLRLGDKIWGKRFAITMSAAASTQIPELFGLTFYFISKQGVREGA